VERNKVYRQDDSEVTDRKNGDWRDLRCGADATVLRRGALSPEVASSSDSASLRKLTLQLDDSTLTGDIAVKNFSKPAATFSLNVDLSTTGSHPRCIEALSNEDLREQGLVRAVVFNSLLDNPRCRR